MNEDKMIFQDSYTEKTSYGTLKIYFNIPDQTDKEATTRIETKLKNFIKVKNFIEALHRVRTDGGQNI